LDNAAKFTKEGGKITLRLGGEATVTVTDDGVGMAPEVAERIFERFYKGDSSHNEKGYGLGLSIARIITESQGGTISVESQEGKGTAFKIELP
jgi:signal transduction histidine kinase